ncbi:hypothetical protein BU17DRAFT_40406 [Hysterangium stoloniferum]|nr:hypothetical protein BU17DRAFT_40406 [Hysterangium stoloniferum]
MPKIFHLLARPTVKFFPTHRVLFYICTGYTNRFCGVLTIVETSFVMIAALIASDTPLQTEWYLRGAMRNGASEQEVRSV